MTTPHSTNSPLLSSIVHLPFRTAAKELGCCEMSLKEFRNSLDNHLTELSDTSLLETRSQKLWLAMMKGEVLSVENVDTAGFLFHVQGKAHHNTFVDMKFYYCKDNWEIQAVTSIHHRPFWRGHRRTLMEVLVGLVGIGLVVGTWFYSSSNYTKQGVESWALQNGYKVEPATASAGTVVATAGGSNSTAAGANTTNTAGSANTGNAPSESASNATNSTANTSGNSTSSGGSTSSNATNTTPSTSTASQSYTFTFTSGMTVHDISVYLQQHQLISDAYSFDNVLQRDGVASSIWPGTYVFKSGMSQAQIIAVLKRQAQ